MRLRHFAARKRKRGASLVMVLVSMTILTIMGTLFTTIAMRSYQYSYSRMCRQQAYYTATSSIESLYAKIKTNGSILNDIVTALDNAYTSLTKGPSEGSSEGSSIGGINIDVTTVRVKIGSTGGGEAAAEGVVGSDFFYTYLGECDLWARYNNAKRTEISLEAEATYNGYSETARAIIAKTNGAASELKKIFDNTFCLQSPISTIVAETTHGDIYVSQPIADTDSAVVKNLGSSYIDAYNTVFAELSEHKSSGGYKGVPGQYLRDNDGNIITDTNTNAGKYNLVLKNGVYGKAQASTADGTLTGHTKPLDMDNTLLTASNDKEKPTVKDLWYNDWAELYMFSAVDGGTAVNGDLYADSKILIGLSDRNLSSRAYLRRWDNTIKRSVFSQQFKGETPWWESWKDLIDDGELDNYLQDKRFNNIDLTGDFEHGFGQDVFFDHYKDGKSVLDNSLSTFRLNGDMYLWEDARIENFDSYNKDNVKEGKKNNIYAAKDLYIDGLYITGWNGAVMETANTVTIGGDVVVQGNAQIMNANIYGDVYCFGDELTIVSSNIYGNVYFTGSNFTADYMRLFQTTDTKISTDNGIKIEKKNINSAKGTYTNGIPDKGNLIINCATTDNLNVTGYDAKAGFGTKDDVGYTDYDKMLSGETAYYRWGATLTNCWVLGTIWSNVNTHIMCSKWDDGAGHELPDYYGDIYVSKYLFIDLIWPYEIADQKLTAIGAGWDHKYNPSGMPTRQDGWISSYHANWHGFTEEEAKELGITDFWGNGDKDEAQAKYDYFADALRFNCFEALDPDTQKIYAERFQFRLNQTGGLSGAQDSDVSHLGTLLVGSGGIYVDGNPEGNDEDKWLNDVESIQFENIYSMSPGRQMWEYEVNEYGAHFFDVDASTIVNGLNQGCSTIDDSLKSLLAKLGGDGLTSRKEAAFDNNAIWKDKLIKIRTWSAPVAGNKTEFNLVDGLIVKYVGEDVPNQGGGGNTLFGNPTTTTVANYIATYSDAFEVTDNGNTLIISDSVTFNCFADFSDYKRVIFDTSEGNIYVKFLYGAQFGNADAKDYDAGAEVVLTGGSMVFWYLHESGSYDFNSPTLEVYPYTRLGLVSAETGSGYGNDGLYIISNDDSLITMGQNAVLNGFVYTPHGQVFIAPAASSYTALNGCMAIESLIMLSTADELQQGGIFPGFGTEAIIDAVIDQYKNIIFNYVQPPLITDWVGLGALTSEEVQDFGAVVWEFLGYY